MRNNKQQTAVEWLVEHLNGVEGKNGLIALKLHRTNRAGVTNEHREHDILSRIDDVLQNRIRVKRNRNTEDGAQLTHADDCRHVCSFRLGIPGGLGITPTQDY